MYRLKLPNRWQKILNSTIYSLLILSMLWVPWPVDASTLAAEEPSSTFTCQERRRAVVCADPETGDKIIVPQQRGRVEIEVTTVSIEDEPILSGPDDEFTAHRNVVGLSIVDSETGEALTKFRPALRIQIAYTRADVRQAGGLRNLTLGYFDGQKMREFADVKIQRNNPSGGIIYATVTELASERPDFYRSCCSPFSAIAMGGK